VFPLYEVWAFAMNSHIMFLSLNLLRLVVALLRPSGIAACAMTLAEGRLTTTHLIKCLAGIPCAEPVQGHEHGTKRATCGGVHGK
jgi:hypothetical protein